MCIVDYNADTGRYLLLDSYPTSSRGTSGTGYAWKTQSQLQDLSLYTTFYIIKSTGNINVEKVTLNVTTDTRYAGDIKQLKATVTPSNATNKTVTWKSSDSSVATVDNNGKVTAVKSGTAKITATAGGKSAVCTVTVKAATPMTLTNKATIRNGTYFIRRLNTDFALAVKGNSKESGANVQIENLDLGNKFEQWQVKHEGGGYYSITNVGSGMCMDVTGNVSESRTNVQQYTPNNTRAQLWQPVSAGHDSYYLVPKCGTDRCLYVNGGYNKAGTNIEILPCIGQDSQKFVFYAQPTGIKLNKTAVTKFEGDIQILQVTITPAEATNTNIVWSSSNNDIAQVDSNGKVTAIRAGEATITAKTVDGGKTATCVVTVKPAVALQLTGKAQVNDGTYYIRRAGTDFAVSIEGKTDKAGGNVVIQHYDEENEYERWIFTHKDGGYYSVVNEASGLALEVEGGSGESRANIRQNTYSGSPAQFWQLAPAGSGRYYLVPKCATNRVMYVNGGYNEDNTNLETCPCIGNNYEWFVLEPVAEALSITEQPEDIDGQVGDKVTVRVGAKGENLTYQWYVRASEDAEWKVSKCTAAENHTTLTEAADGRQLYVVVTDKFGNSVKSNVVTLTVAPVLKITEEPQDAVGAVGEKVTLSVTAEGADLSYQWYVRASESAAWNKSSRTTATNATTLKADSDGRQLYVEVKDKYGNTVKSNVVTLHVISNPLKITAQPEDVSGKPGDKVTLKVEAEGENLTYQWYVRDSENADWKKSSRTTASNATKLSAGSDGRQLYVEVKDKYGNTVDSDVATLHVYSAELKITGQPEDVTGKAGEKVSLTVTAQGEGLTYQWYVRDSEYDNWKKSSCVKATNSTKLNASADGRQLYVVVTDGNGDSVRSRVATLHVN